MKKILLLLLAIFMGAFLVGCGSSSDDDDGLGPTTTILYYAVGDEASSSDLSQDIKDDIKMASIYDTKDEVNIVFQFKLNDSEDIRRGIASDDKEWEDYSVISTGKMTDADTLSEFIEYGMKACPADRYVLLLSGHGSGYWPTETKGCLHTNDDSFLENGTVGEVCKPYGIDCVIYDTCMMGLIENLYCVKDSFKYIIGSERPVKNYSLYNLIYSLIQFEDFETALGMYTKKQGDISNGVYDIRMIKTSNFNLLSNSVKNIITFLNNNKNTYASEINQARSNIKTVADKTYFVDFEDYCNHLQPLISNEEFNNLLEEYKANLNEVLVYNYSTAESDDSCACLGVSLLFPTKDIYIGHYKANYPQTLFAQDTKWNEILDILSE